MVIWFFLIVVFAKLSFGKMTHQLFTGKRHQIETSKLTSLSKYLTLYDYLQITISKDQISIFDGGQRQFQVECQIFDVCLSDVHLNSNSRNDFEELFSHTALKCLLRQGWSD